MIRNSGGMVMGKVIEIWFHHSFLPILVLRWFSLGYRIAFLFPITVKIKTVQAIFAVKYYFIDKLRCVRLFVSKNLSASWLCSFLIYNMFY